MDVAQRCQIPVSVVLDLEHGDAADPDMLRILSEGLSLSLVDLHRVAQGEQLPLPSKNSQPLPLGPEPIEDLSEGPDLDRSLTVIQAMQGLNAAQIEKVLDYVQLLKQAENGRRGSASS